MYGREYLEEMEVAQCLREMRAALREIQDKHEPAIALRARNRLIKPVNSPAYQISALAAQQQMASASPAYGVGGALGRLLG